MVFLCECVCVCVYQNIQNYTFSLSLPANKHSSRHSVKARRGEKNLSLVERVTTMMMMMMADEIVTALELVEIVVGQWD